MGLISDLKNRYKKVKMKEEKNKTEEAKEVPNRTSEPVKCWECGSSDIIHSGSDVGGYHYFCNSCEWQIRAIDFEKVHECLHCLDGDRFNHTKGLKTLHKIECEHCNTIYERNDDGVFIGRKLTEADKPMYGIEDDPLELKTKNRIKCGNPACKSENVVRTDLPNRSYYVCHTCGWQGAIPESHESTDDINIILQGDEGCVDIDVKAVKPISFDAVNENKAECSSCKSDRLHKVFNSMFEYSPYKMYCLDCGCIYIGNSKTSQYDFDSVDESFIQKKQEKPKNVVSECVMFEKVRSSETYSIKKNYFNHEGQQDEAIEIILHIDYHDEQYTINNHNNATQFIFCKNAKRSDMQLAVVEAIAETIKFAKEKILNYVG